ncbi:MAG TPA: hypothetical protein DCZ91_01620 [Lachnospiraceae bacterium]|nr:hypothetical protein [Lachnospiraceae bacterium]
MIYRTEREAFGAYISDLREERKYAMEQVCDGLCTAQRLFQLETGKQSAGKLLQDAILERLGVGAEDYEHYLHYKEYGKWEMRQRILHRISCGKAVWAKELLEEYSRLYGGDSKGGKAVGDRLERQFYLSMWAQIRHMEGAEDAEMRAILEEAVQLTVPGLWEKPLRGRVLSLKEWNLILEAEKCKEGGGEEIHYREIMACLEDAALDTVGMAKIYPKAVCFLCGCIAEKDEAMEAELFGYCNRAVEILRDASRMYYLWEILELREQYLEHRTGNSLEERLETGEYKEENGRSKNADFAELHVENAGWKKALEDIYADYRIQKETFHYCYLYLEKGVSCISDVVRTRRRMLGIKAEELCRGICDIKTLRRLENRKRATQRAIVEQLFERLGLPGEMIRTELVTESPEVRQMMEKLRSYGNERDTEKEEMVLSRIKKMVSTEIRCNRQALMRKEINLRKNRGEINREDYYRQMRTALELTLPFEVFLQEGEKYMTYEEQACIQNIMQEMDKESNEFEKCMKRFEEIYRPVADGELLGTVSGVYGFVMGYVASEMGNCGELERADRYGEVMLREELRSRRLVSLASGLYDRWWNYTERKRKGIPTDRILDGEEELTKCILLSNLGKRMLYESFYKKALEEEKTNKQ